MPWQPRTPQSHGKQAEQAVLREMGARAHPGSGSGSIRFDGSTVDDLIEIKHAKKTINLALAYLEILLQTAIRQQKTARLIIKFPGLRLECTLHREKL